MHLSTCSAKLETIRAFVAKCRWAAADRLVWKCQTYFGSSEGPSNWDALQILTLWVNNSSYNRVAWLQTSLLRIVYVFHYLPRYNDERERERRAANFLTRNTAEPLVSYCRHWRQPAKCSCTHSSVSTLMFVVHPVLCYNITDRALAFLPH